MVKHGIREAGSIDVSAAMALGYASQTAFAMAFRRLTRRNPEQLATARTLTAISLQVPQSLWGSGGPGSLGSSTSTANATMKSDPYCRLQHFSTEGLDMRDDDCCRLQRRSFLTTMPCTTTAAAFRQTGAGTAHAATTDANVDPAKPALQRGNMKLDPPGRPWLSSIRRSTS